MKREQHFCFQSSILGINSVAEALLISLDSLKMSPVIIPFVDFFEIQMAFEKSKAKIFPANV